MDIERFTFRNLPLSRLVQELKKNSKRSKKTKLKTLAVAQNYLSNVIVSNLGRRISLYEIVHEMKGLVEFLRESLNMMNDLSEYKHMHITEIVPDFRNSLTTLVLYLMQSANMESEVLFQFTCGILQCFVEVATEKPTMWFYIIVICDSIRCMLIYYDRYLSGVDKTCLRSLLSHFVYTIPSPILLCGDYCCQYLLVQLLHCFLNLQPESIEENEQILNNIFPDFIHQNYDLLLTEDQFRCFSFLNILNSTLNSSRLILSVPAFHVFIGENLVKSPFEDRGYRFCVNFSYRSKRMHFFVTTSENQEADDVNINFNQIESVCIYKNATNIQQLSDSYTFHVHLNVDIIEITESLADVDENCRSIYVILDDPNGIKEVIHKLKYPVHKYQDDFCHYPHGLLLLYLNQIQNDSDPNEFNDQSDKENNIESMYTAQDASEEMHFGGSVRSNFSLNVDANSSDERRSEPDSHDSNHQLVQKSNNMESKYEVLETSELMFETVLSNISPSVNANSSDKRRSEPDSHDSNHQLVQKSNNMESILETSDLIFETVLSNISPSVNANSSDERRSEPDSHDSNRQLVHESSMESMYEVLETSQLEFETVLSNISPSVNANSSDERRSEPDSHDSNRQLVHESSMESMYEVLETSQLEFEAVRPSISPSVNADSSNERRSEPNSHDSNRQLVHESNMESVHEVLETSQLEFETVRSNISNSFNAKTSNEIDWQTINEISFESEHSVHYEVTHALVNNANPQTVAFESLRENVTVTSTEHVHVTLQSDVHSEKISECHKTVKSQEDHFPLSLGRSNSLMSDLPRHTSTPIHSPIQNKQKSKVATKIPCYRQLIPDDKENLDSSDPYAFPHVSHIVVKTYKKREVTYRKRNNNKPKEKQKRAEIRKQPECLPSAVSPEFPDFSMLNHVSPTLNSSSHNQKKFKNFAVSANDSKQGTIDLLSNPVKRQFEQICEDAKEELKQIFLSANYDEKRLLLKKDVNLNFGVNSKSALTRIKLTLIGQKQTRKRKCLQSTRLQKDNR